MVQGRQPLQLRPSRLPPRSPACCQCGPLTLPNELSCPHDHWSTEVCVCVCVCVCCGYVIWCKGDVSVWEGCVKVWVGCACLLACLLSSDILCQIELNCLFYSPKMEWQSKLGHKRMGNIQVQSALCGRCLLLPWHLAVRRWDVR